MAALFWRGIAPCDAGIARKGLSWGAQKRHREIMSLEGKAFRSIREASRVASRGVKRFDIEMSWLNFS